MNHVNRGEGLEGHKWDFSVTESHSMDFILYHLVCYKLANALCDFETMLALGVYRGENEKRSNLNTFVNHGGQDMSWCEIISWLPSRPFHNFGTS